MGIETSFGQFAEEAATKAEGAARDIAYWKGIAQAGGIAESNNDWKAAYDGLLSDNEEARKRCNALRDQVTAYQHMADELRAKAAGLVAELQQTRYFLKNVKEVNVRLRLEIDMLGSPHSACNQESAAWRWACGDEAQKIAVCELDGTEWIPVLSSRQALDIAAEDIREQHYSPVYTKEQVLREMARTDIEI